MRKTLPAAALALALAGCAKAHKGPDAAQLPGLGAAPPAAADKLFARLKTNRGEILLRLHRDEAPKTVENFTALATGAKEWTHPETGKTSKTPLYDGTRFFRVIPGFIIQGGDPTNTGSGEPGFHIADEIRPGRGFDRPGLVAMAGSAADSGGCQFFITLAPAPWLDDKHTIFGEVVRGKEVLEAIALAPRQELDPKTGRPLDRPLEPQLLKQVVIVEAPEPPQ